jgi:hypothetical protein
MYSVATRNGGEVEVEEEVKEVEIGVGVNVARCYLLRLDGGNYLFPLYHKSVVFFI